MAPPFVVVMGLRAPPAAELLPASVLSLPRKVAVT
jgi:hypothetical protein